MRAQKLGFTIIEILIVVVIIGVLAGILGNVFITSASRAKNEGQANQIKKILHACEQFKQDFGDYPSPNANNGSAVGTATYTSNNWIEHNSLAYRLCQGIGGANIPAALNSRTRTAWCGSYLESTDVALAQIGNNGEIMDLWSVPGALRPLAYNFVGSTFTGTITSLATNPTETNYSSWTNSTTALNNVANGAAAYLAYTRNGAYYGRPNGRFLPPVSYALKGQWIDSEMNMPEIWSRGDDGLYIRLQYKKGGGTFSQANDADNVGGNINLMKVQ